MLTLQGSNVNEHQMFPSTTQYQPVVVAGRAYQLTWTNNALPSVLDLSVYHLPQSVTNMYY